MTATRRLCLALVCALAVPAAVCSAAEVDWSLQPQMQAAALVKDGRYRLEESKAKQTLQQLKQLREYAHQVRDGADGLYDEMRHRHYVDWADTRLLPHVSQARAYDETVHQTFDLEKKNLDAALKLAQAGDYSSLTEVTARIASFEADYEARIKAVEPEVAAVRAAYAHHWGNAQQALAKALAHPLVQEMLAQKNPKLISEIKLEPETLRPIHWKIVVHKDQQESDDARFGKLPQAVSIVDGQQTHWYHVVVK